MYIVQEISLLYSWFSVENPQSGWQPSVGYPKDDIHVDVILKDDWKNNFCYSKYWQIPARPDELRLNCGFSSMAIQYGVKTNGLYPLAACIFLWLWPKQTFLWNIINIFTIIIYCVVLKNLKYRVFIKYCVFSLKFFDFSELCQFCCCAGVLPAWCVYTHWHRGKTESGIF